MPFILVLLSTLDIFLTSILVVSHGSICEGNPIGRFLYEMMGVSGFVFLKLLMISLVVGICSYIGGRIALYIYGFAFFAHAVVITLGIVSMTR